MNLTLKKSLGTLFCAEILRIVFGIVFSGIPLFRLISYIVIYCVIISALFKIGPINVRYKYARNVYLLNIGLLVLGVMNVLLFKLDIVTSIFDVVELIFKLLYVYFIIYGTNDILSIYDERDTVRKGERIWSVYFCCMFFLIVFTLIKIIGIVVNNSFVDLLYFISSLGVLGGLIVFLVFLNKAQKTIAQKIEKTENDNM